MSNALRAHDDREEQRGKEDVGEVGVESSGSAERLLHHPGDVREEGLHREPHGAASRVRRRGDEGDEEHLELVERDGLERDGRGAARSGRRGRGLGLRVARAVDGMRGGNAGIRTHRDGNQRGGRGEDHDGKEGRHPRPNACGRHRRVMRVLPERRATAVRPSCGKATTRLVDTC